MTRETKIGLLVGLAFIIVIGILLSDYNRNENPSAALPLYVSDNVKTSTATLHNGSAQIEVVPPPAPATPARPVPTHDEMHQETRIDIGPGGPGPVALNTGNDRHVIQPGPGTPIQITPAVAGADAPNNVTANNSGGVNLPDTETYNPHPPIAPQPAAPEHTVNGAKAYVAIESDTVSKLAGRFLGGNTKTNREAILAINPSLKANPNNVIVGRTYMIPPRGTAVTSVSVPTSPIHPLTPTLAPTPAPASTEAAHYFYTVKENDSLWKIAAEQLGDGSAYEAIKELNKDVLKGRDDVRPNMRLRLPAKPVASAN